MKSNKWLVIILVIAALYLVSVAISALYDTQGTNSIAVIPINGAITLEGGSSALGGSSGASSKTIVSFITQADKNNQVKGILLDINSPGGTVLASKEIAEAIKKTNKPVVAVIREVGASGAYWIASSSDYIIADELSITGSIGVIGSYLEFSELFEEYGITYQQLTGGQYKDTGSPFKEPTAEEKRILQQKINTIHEAFIQEVATNREMSYADASKVATGIFYLGTEAKELNLIDAYGGIEEGVTKVEELANITDATLITYQQRTTVFDLLAGVSAANSYNFGRGFARELQETSVSNTFEIVAQ